MVLPQGKLLNESKAVIELFYLKLSIPEDPAPLGYKQKCSVRTLSSLIPCTDSIPSKENLSTAWRKIIMTQYYTLYILSKVECSVITNTKRMKIKSWSAYLGRDWKRACSATWTKWSHTLNSRSNEGDLDVCKCLADLSAWLILHRVV